MRKSCLPTEFLPVISTKGFGSPKAAASNPIERQLFSLLVLSTGGCRSDSSFLGFHAGRL